MRVLVACECSGVLRRALRAIGVDAWSCDTQKSEDNSDFHFTENVINHDIIKLGWDALIAFPDCTFLTVSGNRWMTSPWRMEARHLALQFVKTLWALPIKKKCVENPIGVLPTIWRRHTQIIQPHEFWAGEVGRGEVKATCLYLDGLPPLVKTTPNETGRHPACWLEPPAPNRKRNRSRTYEGIATAMSNQWFGSNKS
jgi:hypothetical protein